MAGNVARRTVARRFQRIATAAVHLIVAMNVGAALAQEQPGDTTEEVVVSGDQPGPGLWKVSHGTHVMWILGTQSPSPKKMTWRSQQVESVIASAKQILGGESMSANVGFFKGMRLLPSILRARFNPDGAVLKDLLEPAVYERWLPLRKKYFDDDADVEKVRPMLIAFQLYAKATDEAGLTRVSVTSKVLSRAAKKHKLKIESPEIKVEIDNPRQAIRDFTETPRDADVACLVAAIDRLGSDVEVMKQRANAWAVGDVETLKQLPVPVQEAGCMEALMSAPGLQDELDSAKDRALARWLADAEAALAANDVTFAILPIAELLDDNGRLAKLRERGYLVESPSG